MIALVFAGPLSSSWQIWNAMLSVLLPSRITSWPEWCEALPPVIDILHRVALVI